MAHPRAVHRGYPIGGIDRFGDESLVEGPAGRVELAVPFRTGAFRLFQDALVGAAQIRIAERRSGIRDTISKVEAAGLEPLGSKDWGAMRDRLRDRRHHRVTGRRVLDRVLEHVAQAHRAVLAEQHQPGTEGTRHAGGEQAGPGNVVQPELLKVADAGRLRRRPLAADDLDLGAARVPEDGRQITARAVEVRLDDLEDKPGGHRRIEGVAAPLEDRHPGL